jgi:plasmid stabilization system protein ParE
MGGGPRRAAGRVTALVLGLAAIADLEGIHGHDDSVDDGLGSRFVEALDVLFVRLDEFPRSAPLVAGYVDVRRAVVRGFPSVVFYRHRAERIDVLRVSHAAREDADRPHAEKPSR